MTNLILDPGAVSRLQAVNEAVNFCDPTGRVLGRFVPTIDTSQREPLTPEVSDEELDRREREEESYTTDEVLACLEKLPCSESAGSDPR